MKKSKIVIFFTFILVVSFLYFRPFFMGHEAQLIDRFVKIEDQTPLFIVYSARLTQNEDASDDLKKTAVRIFRSYNISKFELLLSPIRQSRGIYVARLKFVCGAGVCWSYDFEQVKSSLNDNDMQAVKEFLDSNSGTFSRNSFFSFAKRRLGEYEANRIDKLLDVAQLELENFETQYQHKPLESFFFSPKPLEEKQ